MEKPRQGFRGLWNTSFGFFGIQIGFALQNANVSRIFQSLGTAEKDLAFLWIAAPLTGLPCCNSAASADAQLQTYTIDRSARAVARIALT